LSMGALLSLVVTARQRVRVEGLVLMAPVVQLRGRDAKALRALRFLPLFDVAPKWIVKKNVDIEADDVRAEAPLLPRYPVRAALELFAVQDLALAAEKGITCPSLVVGAVHDHVVDTDAAMALAHRLPFSRTVLLQRGCHIIPRDLDRALAITEACHFVEDLSR
jgi:pimeloyl-ACP methyl ester carboxylesterase